MKAILLMCLLSASLCGYGQIEWEDIKSHEGSGENSGRANANPGLLNGRFRNTKLRNREKNETLGADVGLNSKQSAKAFEKLKQERARAMDALRGEYFRVPGQRIVDCGSCAGIGLQGCADCQGRGGSECAVCHGTPKIDCRAYDGNGLVADLTCVSCNGTGKKVCFICGGSRLTCVRCSGLGYNNCAVCRDTRKQLTAGASGDSTIVDDAALPWNAGDSLTSSEFSPEKQAGKKAGKN